MNNQNHYSRFRIEKTGEEFVYSNYTNGLYDLNMTPMSEEAEPDEVWELDVKATRKLTKSNKPRWLRILLGHACNYSCSYCMQKDIGNPNERAKISTLDFFLELIDDLDLSELERVDLWGGETLLYWKTIMPIMEKLDNGKIYWYLPTNGVPLRMKHVEFLSQLKGKVGFGVSHDGPGHERLRGREFIHDIQTVETFRAISESNNLAMSFNPVLSNTNFDIFEINKFFYDYLDRYNLSKERIGLSWGLGRIYSDEDHAESVSYEHVIHGENLETFKGIIKKYVDQLIEQEFHGVDHKLLKNSLFHSGMGVLPYARTLQKQELPTSITSCGADDEQVLSVDMAGNVRTCPHTDATFISGYLGKIEEVELKKLDLERYDRHCHACPVFRLCKSNCPIKVPDEVFYANCAIEKVHYRAIQDGAFKILFNSDVTLVEDGLDETSARTNQY